MSNVDLVDLFGSGEDTDGILERIKALDIVAPVVSPRKKKSPKKKKSPVRMNHNPYLEYRQRRNKGSTLFIIYSGIDIHITNNKSIAESLGRDLQREIEKIRTTEYMWILNPGFKLRAHGLIHEQMDIRPDGSVIIKLRTCEDTLHNPMSYSTEEIVKLKTRFARFAGPSMNHIAKRKDLIRYILDSASIVYTPTELNKLQSILQSVFTLDMDAEVGFSFPEQPVAKSKMIRRRKKCSKLLGP